MRMRRVFIPHSLSARVLWLTILIVLLMEIAVLMPSLGHERQTWLAERVTRVQLAAFSVADSVQDAAMPLDPKTRDALLKLSGSEAFTLIEGEKTISLSPAQAVANFDQPINLDNETLFDSTWRAGLEVLGLAGERLPVIATSAFRPDTRIEITVDQAALTAHLRRYGEHLGAAGVSIALITGGLVFLALDRLLVRPMRIMTASIVGFRRDPEYAGLSGLRWLSTRGDDEIARAARELVVMQDELRTALWRNARLAALGTAVAKINHDLRNILSSALLVVDHFEDIDDPVLKHAADTLIPAVERAAELVGQTVDFAREGPPAITPSKVVLRELVDEAAAVLHPVGAAPVVENQVPGSLVLTLDRTQIFRVLLNLLRNAAEAGASRITLAIEGDSYHTQMVVADNGPGLPRKVRANLFRPFSGSGKQGGSGLGLAIARDLIRAHGGDLLLRKTGPEGTEFVMGLSMVDVAGE
jgi:signal transduction histidine kinase